MKATGTTEERPIRVLLVDDDPMVIRGLEFMLEAGSAGAISVVGTASDGSQVIAAVHAHYPDVILMDVRMPVQDGISATRDVAELPHPPHVIVLTTFDGDDEPVRAAQAGAAGFLLKTESPADIVTAIRAVAKGEGAVSRRTAKQLFQHIAGDVAAERARAGELLGRLSDRERQVAETVTRGLTNREIAAELFISEGTVKAHLATVQEKLEVDNRVLVAVTAARAGA